MSEPFFDYIANNRMTVSNRMYGYEDQEKKYTRYTYIPLPETPENKTLLLDAMRKRKTTRKFKQDPLPLASLSSLLRYSIAQNAQSSGFKKYTFPSGGGFYPIENYLLVHNVQGLKRGVYHYSSVEHAMARIGDSPDRLVEEINRDYGCDFESIPPVILHMTLVKSRCIHKYGSLIYLVYPMEAGHRGQNLYLSAAALGLGVCGMGGGNYQIINSMLGIDGVAEHHIYGIAIGEPA